eukprot:1270495-Rhodomonas_salina.3
MHPRRYLIPPDCSQSHLTGDVIIGMLSQGRGWSGAGTCSMHLIFPAEGNPDVFDWSPDDVLCIAVWIQPEFTPAAVSAAIRRAHQPWARPFYHRDEGTGRLEGRKEKKSDGKRENGRKREI